MGGERKQIKLISDGGVSGTKISKSGYGGVCQSLDSDGRVCVSAFGRNLASVAVKMFSHLI
jgi:hypothetical protein